MGEIKEKQLLLGKQERLSGTKNIEILFKEGQSFISYPLRVLFRAIEQTSSNNCSILVSVPKKRLKKAVHRNKIKRLIRESYRLNKSLLNFETYGITLDIAFIYVKDDISNFYFIQKAMIKALTNVSNLINDSDETKRNH